MPDNPTVPELVKTAGAAVSAQKRLRDAMAAVAAEVRATPPAPAPAPPASA